MTKRSVRQARRESDFDGQASESGHIGFLDVNFGVLSIFIVVFAVRIILEQNVSGQYSDVLIALTQSEEGKARAVLHHPDGVQTFDQGPEEETASQAAQALRVAILPLAQDADGPLRVQLLLLPDGYGMERHVSFLLSDSSAVSDAVYLSKVTRLDPVADDADLLRIIADWHRDHPDIQIGQDTGGGDATSR